MVVVLAAVAMAGPGGDERLAELLEHMRRKACAVIGDLDRALRPPTSSP